MIVAGEAHYKVNVLDQERFVLKFGTLHEHSPWIAKEACGRIAVATDVSAWAWVSGCKSQNTKQLELHFRALLTEEGTRHIELARA